MPDKVQFIEIVPSEDLKEKEAGATEAFRRFFPDTPPLKLYRTADNRIGFQTQLLVTVGDRDRLQKAYSAVMRVLGYNKGRPEGERKVQTKLRLRESVYKSLKEAAKASNITMSGLVEELVCKANLIRYQGPV